MTLLTTGTAIGMAIISDTRDSEKSRTEYRFRLTIKYPDIDTI